MKNIYFYEEKKSLKSLDLCVFYKCNKECVTWSSRAGITREKEREQ